MQRPSQGVRRWLEIAITGAGLLIALAAMIASRFHGWSSACWDVAWTSAACSALAGALLARRKADQANRARWSQWALATALWLVGQVAWDIYGLTGFPRSPNLADLCWWGFALLVMTSMLRARGPRSLRMVAAVESLPLIAAAIALTIGELWKTAAASHLALAQKLSALTYPALYASAAVLMLHAMIAGALGSRRKPALQLVLAGMAAQALAFILWSSQLLQGTYVPGRTLLDPLWVVGMGAIGVGGLLASRSPEEPALVEEPSYKGGLLPAGMFLTLMVALGLSRLYREPEPMRIVLEVGLVFSAVALLVRSKLLADRMRAMLARERQALTSLAQREAELARLNEQLVEDSRRDPLTGISNRRALADDLPMLEAMGREHGSCFAVALCDVDHFKAYNDRLGHLAGDQALRMIAGIARGALRTGDCAYRFGGEELLLLLRDVSLADAHRVAERVRHAVQRAALPHPDGEEGILTVSIGVAAGAADTAGLLNRADAALYEAKHSGRNQVVCAGEQAVFQPARRERIGPVEEPVPRHLRSMLAVSRAAAGAEDPLPVLDALAEAIRSELSFQVVAVNLLEVSGEELRVVIVKGDEDARSTLLGTSAPLGEWLELLRGGEEVHGAVWLRAGSYDWQSSAAVWTPPAVAGLGEGSWHPEDMLLLPLRDSLGELLGVVSVDEPLLGRRPTPEEISVLMAVVDHAALAIERSGRGADGAGDQSVELRLAAVLLLAETLDMRDASTARHARTVGDLARRTAQELGFAPSRVERIHAAGVLHDLGKLGIGDAILHKPGPLDESEWREMRRHPDVGAQILEHAGMHDIAGWVRQHHERIDGRGYPLGCKEEEISLEARILAVADSYEAMIADRPYRPGMSAEQAREELLRCAGSQFDPAVVEAFLTAFDAAPLKMEPVLQPAA